MSAILVRASDLDIHEVPDGYIVYQNARDNVCYLNKTAAVVFELCDGQLKDDEIVARVAQLFGLNNSSHGEIKDCLNSLVREGLVRSNSK